MTGKGEDERRRVADCLLNLSSPTTAFDPVKELEPPPRIGATLTKKKSSNDPVLHVEKKKIETVAERKI